MKLIQGSLIAATVFAISLSFASKTFAGGGAGHPKCEFYKEGSSDEDKVKCYYDEVVPAQTTNGNYHTDNRSVENEVVRHDLCQGRPLILPTGYNGSQPLTVELPELECHDVLNFTTCLDFNISSLALCTEIPWL